MMYKLIALLAAGLLSTVSIAEDQDKPMRSADATFKSLDRDADERLSKMEVSGDSTLSQHFASLDADSDGYLTKREYAAHAKPDKSKEGREY